MFLALKQILDDWEKKLQYYGVQHNISTDIAFAKS